MLLYTNYFTTKLALLKPKTMKTTSSSSDVNLGFYTRKVRRIINYKSLTLSYIRRGRKEENQSHPIYQ